jgi:hypothetical protein
MAHLDRQLALVRRRLEELNHLEAQLAQRRARLEAVLGAAPQPSR